MWCCEKYRRCGCPVFKSQLQQFCTGNGSKLLKLSKPRFPHLWNGDSGFRHSLVKVAEVVNWGASPDWEGSSMEGMSLNHSGSYIINKVSGLRPPRDFCSVWVPWKVESNVGQSVRVELWGRSRGQRVWRSYIRVWNLLFPSVNEHGSCFCP